MNKIVIDLHYFPTVECFCELINADEIYLEAYESFQKQTYRTRAIILTATKALNLNVPVSKEGKKGPILDLKINYEEDWVTDHKRSIKTAYGNAPFFEFYSDYFFNVLDKRHANLFELNFELLTICLKLIGVQKQLKKTETYLKNYGDEISDLRSIYSPKNKNMPEWQYSYYQHFGNDFVKGISILDLLFCAGPESLSILKQAQRTNAI